MMDLLKKFIAYYSNKNLFNKKDRLLLAVSGGVDSVVLCKLCALAKLDFGIAHCNFQLRGDDSNRDEDFVRSLAENMGVPFYTIRFNTKQYAADNNLSTQVSARELRYGWFDEIRDTHQYNYILTAHHADDNIETVVMNFFRGTGIKGLTGIQPVNGYIRRPLLFVRRHILEAFLKEQNLSFVQDESNLQNDYTRNYFRNKVLPMVAEVYPEVSDNLLANINRMNDVALLYDEAILKKYQKLVTNKDGCYFISVQLLLQQIAPKTVLYEILKPFNFTAAQLTDISQLLYSDTGKYVLSATHRILKNRKHLIIAPQSAINQTAVIINEPGGYFFAGGKLTVSAPAKLQILPKHPNTALLDAKSIQYPIILRPWKTGDYFYPLGMQKKKKIARFLIDNKLSMLEKEHVWVLEMNLKIIWVIGHRIDNRFKITPATQKTIQFTFEP
ncbi:MAG: tRNA lysidine(34) synthetase TilS [Niabella sp.]